MLKDNLHKGLYKGQLCNDQGGFTLGELLIVVAILGLLAAIGIPQYQGYRDAAKADVSKYQYSSMLNLIGAELTKCSAGADNILQNTPQVTPCSGDNNTLLTAFVAYGNASNKNAYDASLDAYMLSSTPANTTPVGQTVLTAVPGMNGKFTVTTTFSGDDDPETLGPTNLNRE